MPDMSRFLRLMSLSDPLPQPSQPPPSGLSDRIVCQCCQKPFKVLRHHLQAVHGMSEESYRRTFAIAAGEPLVAPSYAAARARHLAAYGRAQRS